MQENCFCYHAELGETESVEWTHAQDSIAPLWNGGSRAGA